LGFDLVDHGEARDGQRAGLLEPGDDTVGGSVGQSELQGVDDVAVVVHAEQELFVVADAAVRAHHNSSSQNVATSQ